MMNDHVYKTIELTGTSTTTQEEAIAQAINRASQTLRHLRWFQVIDSRGRIESGRVAQWQVTLKVGMTIEDDLLERDMPEERSVAGGTPTPNLAGRAALGKGRKRR